MHMNPGTVTVHTSTSTSTVVLLIILSLFFFTNYTHAMPLSPIPIPISLPLQSNPIHTLHTLTTLTIRNEPSPEIVHIQFHEPTDLPPQSQSQSQSQYLPLPDLPQHTTRDPSWFLRALTQVLLYTFTHIPNQDLGSPRSSIQFLHPGPSPDAVPDLGVGFELPFDEETYPWYSFSFDSSHRGCLPPNGCTGRILYVSPRQKDRIEVVVNDGHGREVLHVGPNRLVRFNNEGRLVY
ncbi:hypothetical protein F5890DRAFT_1532407 [Lentinula detonsa]|uniref:Uncharacterized protein n=1 Tax=Lentinula detonsa TaxID=2804962 RepID=A0AA38UQU4_9AGAR|nr:hypothetical protein F5890DRAFT_1532407 [Lentinula detonsa]